MADLKLIGAVAVKVRPDAKGFRGETKRAVLRELAGQEYDVVVNLELDAHNVKERAKRIVNDVKREADESIGIKMGVDKESLRRMARDIDRQLKDLDGRSIKVKMDDASLRNANQKLRDQLREAGAAGLKVDITTDEGLRKAKDDIDDFVREEDGRQVSFQANMRGLDLAAAQLAYATRSRKVDFFVHVNQRSLAIAEGLIKSLAGLGVLSEVGNRIEDVILNFDKFSLKSAGWATAIGNVANMLTFVGTSAFTIGEGVVQSIGLLALMPTALATVAAGVLINIAAFKDFGAAIEGDADALAALPPKARAAADALRGTWTAIQKPVQKAFWDGMSDSMQRFAKNTIPVLRDGLTRVADDVGRFGAGILDSFEEIAKNGDMQKMFGNLEGFFQNATAASKPFFDALNTLGLRGSDYLPRFGTWLADISQGFKDWVDEADKAGKINKWIEDGVQSLKDMSSVGKSVVGMFQGITRAVNDAGGGGLPEFRDNMAKIADIMQSEPFRSRMATIFAGARQGATELNDGVKDLGRTIGEASDYTGQLLIGLGKIGGGLLSGVAKMLDQLDFQSGTLEGVRDMQEALDDLGPSFEGIGRIIGNMSRVAGEVFKGVAPIINSIVGFLDRSVGKLTGNLEKLAPALTGMVNALVTAAHGPLSVVVDLLNSVLDVFTSMPGPIQGAVLAFGAFVLLKDKLLGFFSPLTSAWGKFTGVAKDGSKAMADGGKLIGDSIFYADGAVRKFDGKPMQKQMQGIWDKAKVVGKGIGTSLLGFMGGPWGVALAGATVAFAAMGDAAAKQKGKVDDLRTALDGQTGMNEATKNVIATQLRAKDSFLWMEQNSIAQDAEDIGISLRDLQRAAEGVPEAIDRVNDSLNRAADARNPLEKFNDMAKILGDSKLLGVMNGFGTFLGDMWGSAASKAGEGLQSIRDDLASAQGQIEDTARQMGVPINTAAGITAAIDILADKASTADEKLRAVNDILRQMNGDTSKEDAIQRSNDSIRGLRENVAGLIADAKEHKRALPDLFNNVTKQIDTTTAAGSRLRSDVMSTAGAMKTSALEQALAMEDPKVAIETLKTQWGTYRAQLGEQLKLAGLNPAEVEAILKQLDFPPGVVEVLLSGESSEKMKTDIAALMADGKAKTDKPLVAPVKADTSVFDRLIQASTAKGQQFAGYSFVPKLNANKTPLDQAIAQATVKGNDLDKKTFTPDLDANKSPFDTMLSGARKFGEDFDRAVYESSLNATGNALTMATSVWDMIGNFAGKSFTANITATVAKILGGSADGSMHDGRNWDRRYMPKFFANGGVENHTAQIAKPSSTLRVWAEPETGGEAYIPLAASKRTRSMEILDQVADRFGYELYAKGGIRGGAGSEGSPSGGTHYHNHIDAAPGVNYLYAQEIARETTIRQRDMQALYDFA